MTARWFETGRLSLPKVPEGWTKAFCMSVTRRAGWARRGAIVGYGVEELGGEGSLFDMREELLGRAQNRRRT